MANLRSCRFQILLFAFQFLMLLQTKVSCLQYKVGDLDAWGIPTSANPSVYTNWSKNNNPRIGDSLLFLYPPSQDSVIQVSESSYNSCNITDPILYMNNGNSLFNITANGDFFFTSGEPGHCEKKQKLHVAVGNVSAFSPSSDPGAFPANAPSYPTVFGPIPQPPPTSSSPLQLSFSVFFTAVIGSAASAIFNGIL
ncbi:mavicyanin-like [Mangifera indica]|uniref:mavicyanin-like n=1 Tax=Mangifera indica TaxID=29780 RepID=UPI001CFB2AF2|nr:mavicyanin-like [Mangifera indica]